MTLDGSITSRAAAGIWWTSIGALLAKGVALLAQLILAWFIEPDAFGVFALATSIGVVFTVLQQGGLAQVLVSRPKRLPRNLPSATTIATSFSVLVAGILWMAAGPLAEFFSEPQLVPMLPHFAMATAFAGIASPANAALQAELKFGRAASVEAITGIGRSGLSILMAYYGWGVWALVWPVSTSAGMRALLLWCVSGHGFKFGFERLRAAALLREGVPLMAAQLILLATWQGDYLIVQLLVDSSTLGVYFLAFTLANQSFTLISQSVRRVLFAGLSQLGNDEARRSAAYMKSANELSTLVFPLCFAQIVLATPLVQLFFRPEYHGMIPLIQITSVGIAFRCVGSPAGALFMARRKFLRLLVVNSTYAIVFLTVVSLLTYWFGVIGTAWGVSIYFVLLGPAHIYLALPMQHRHVGQMFAIFFEPFAISAVVVALVMVGRWYCSALAGGWEDIVISCLAYLLLHLLLYRLVAPQRWQIIKRRVVPLAGRLRRRLAGDFLLQR